MLETMFVSSSIRYYDITTLDGVRAICFCIVLRKTNGILLVT